MRGTQAGPDPGRRAVVHVLMFVHSAISAGTFLVAKRALEELSPFELALVRFTAAAALYGALLWRRRVRVARRDLAGLAAVGVLAIPLNQGLFLLGLTRTTAGHAALLYALAPVFVFLVSHGRLRERVTVAKVAGVTLAFAGVLGVLLPRGAWSRVGADSPLTGDLLVLGGVIAYSLFATLGKPYAERYGALASTGLLTISGALAYLPLGLVASDMGRFAAVSRGGWLAAVYLAVVASVLSYLIYYWVLARVDASRAAIWSNLQPVLTAVLAWLIYGEQLTPGFAVAGAMVLAGVALTQSG